ncbi:hypothetical protein Hanom_Chr11g01042911 [Helianthus anomalus]
MKTFPYRGYAVLICICNICALTFLLILSLCTGGMHFTASNNDCGVREYDMDGFQLVNHFLFIRPVNVSFFLFINVNF